MAKKVEFISRVKSAKFNDNIRKSIIKAMPSFEDDMVKITIETVSGKRSVRQNGYLHLLFTFFMIALNDLGNEYSMLRVKEMCKERFLKVDVVNVDTGEIIGHEIRHTADLNKEEMKQFIESVIRWGAEFFNIILPYPNEIMTLDFDKEPTEK